MQRLFLVLLFAPLAALAQPDEGTFTLEFIGSIPQYDGPNELTGQARFGGAPTNADAPPGTNSVLTFQALNRATVTLYSKDVYRPGLRAPRQYSNTYDPGTTTLAPPHDIVSGVPEDFNGLSLFDYGLRLELPDGRTFYSYGRPSGPVGSQDFRISYSTDDEVRGRVRVPIKEDGASYSSGAVLLTFSATPSEAPLPGLQPGQALVVVTGEHEIMTTLPATWSRGMQTNDCTACDPWILRLGMGGPYAGGLLSIQGVRPADAPQSTAGIGWGGFRPGANGQLPSGFVRTAMLYDVTLPGETQTWHSAGRPGKPVDLQASPSLAPYSIGGGNGLDYGRIYADGRGMSEDERAYVGWTDFHAWKAKLNPLPREVRAVVRISVRYHTPDGASQAPEQIAGSGLGMGGSFSAFVDGLRFTGGASVVDTEGVFSLSMTGVSQSAGMGGTFSFGGRGELRERTYRFTDDATPSANRVVGTFSASGPRPMRCLFEPGSSYSLRVTDITDDTVEGEFTGQARCEDPKGAVYIKTITGGEFEALRPLTGGQINVSMPSCITLPPGVQLPPNSPIPAC
ncbi:MAG: hypothetical protein AAF170_07280 [Bacteroidota bacterium]